jgi:hypothetical protein
VQVHWDVLKGDPNANPEKQHKQRYAYKGLKPHDTLASNRAKKPPPAWEGDGEFVIGDSSRTDACRRHNTRRAAGLSSTHWLSVDSALPTRQQILPPKV